MIHSKQAGNVLTFLEKNNIYTDYQERCLSPIRRFTTRSPIFQQCVQPAQRGLSPIRRSPLQKDKASVIFHRTPIRARSPLSRTPIKQHKTEEKNLRIQFVTTKTENSPQSQPNSNSKMFNKLMSNIGTNVQANQKENFDVFTLLGDPAFMQNNSRYESNSRNMEGSSKNYFVGNQAKEKNIRVGTFTALINNIQQKKVVTTKQEHQNTSQVLFRDTQVEYDQNRQGATLAKIRKNIKNNKIQHHLPSPAKLHKLQSDTPRVMEKPQNAFKYFSVMHQNKNQTLPNKASNDQFSGKKQIKKELTLKANLVESIQQDFNDVIGLLNKIKNNGAHDNSKESNQTEKKVDVNISNKNIFNEESLNMNF